MILRHTLLASVLLCTSSLSFADTTAPSTTDLKTQQLLQLGTKFVTNGVDGIKTAAESYITNEMNSEAVGVTKSFLQKYFPTVELQLDMFDYRKATSGVLIVSLRV
ncbi:MAG: hypothetical protein ACKO2J_04190 [Candidatus Methylopumilus sp.]